MPLLQGPTRRHHLEACGTRECSVGQCWRGGTPYRSTNNSGNAKPGTQLAINGSVACPGVGYHAMSLGATVTVRAGDSIAFPTDNANAIFAGWQSSGILQGSGLCNGRAGREPTFAPTAAPNPTTGLKRNRAGRQVLERLPEVPS